MKRREILKRVSLLPLVGSVPFLRGFASPTPSPAKGIYLKNWRTPVINAGVTMTFLSGSLMMPEILEAIN